LRVKEEIEYRHVKEDEKKQKQAGQVIPIQSSFPFYEKEESEGCHSKIES
jgi:hypothetical protein